MLSMMHRAALHLRELNDDPFVSFTIILHEGVTVGVQDSRRLLGLLVGSNNLGPVL